MKLYSSKADSFIKAPKGAAVLVYGPDTGAVRDIARQLTKSFLPDADSMSVTEITGDQLKADEGLLDAELNSVSFFADRRVVKLVDAADANLQAVTAALEKPNPDVFLIITADELKKDSKLRKYFEDSKTLMTIICYKDDTFSVRKYVAEKLREAGVRADPDALDYLAANLGEDKQVTNNEVEKVLLYLGDEKQLKFEDVTAILADNSEITLTDISYAISMRDSAKLEKALNRAFLEGVNPIPVVRAVSWHFQRLMNTKMMIMNGMSAEIAVKSLRPQVFFRQEELFKASLRKWNENQIKSALVRLSRAEFDSKASGLEPETACRHSLLRLIV